MRLGIADHLGWAVVVVAGDDHVVASRARIPLVAAGISDAPVHYESARIGIEATAELIARARASIADVAGGELDALAAGLAEPVTGVCLRGWPPDFPTDVETLCRAPWEARADAVMYRQELAELASARGWDVHLYDARAVLGQAAGLLGDRAGAVLQPGLGPPWTKDHRVALAATVAAG